MKNIEIVEKESPTTGKKLEYVFIYENEDKTKYTSILKSEYDEQQKAIKDANI